MYSGTQRPIWITIRIPSYLRYWTCTTYVIKQEGRIRVTKIVIHHEVS